MRRREYNRRAVLARLQGYVEPLCPECASKDWVPVPYVLPAPMWWCRDCGLKRTSSVSVADWRGGGRYREHEPERRRRRQRYRAGMSACYLAGLAAMLLATVSLVVLFGVGVERDRLSWPALECLAACGLTLKYSRPGHYRLQRRCDIMHALDDY